MDRLDDAGAGGGTARALGDIREAIDAIDHRLVQVLAARAEHVARAAVTKPVLEDEATRLRRREIVARAKVLAAQGGAPPAVVEAVFEAMLSAFAAYMRDVRAASERAAKGA